MVDRIVAQFPISDHTGYSATEIVVAIEGGYPVTYERSRLTSKGYERTTGTIRWSDVEVALSAALCNAGFGHRNDRLAAKAEQEQQARRERFQRLYADMDPDERHYALNDGWVR